MMIQVSLKAIAFVVYTLALLAGAFGISYAVFEWRDDDVNSPAVFKCQEEAWDEYVDTRKDYPDPPTRGASDSARQTYDREWAATEAHNDLAWEEYEETFKDCYP